MARSGGAVATARVVDKQERQINLVLVLLNTTSPLPLSRLRKDVPGYDGGADAVRQKFERDKRELRTSGIEIRSVPIEGDDQVGYRIDPASFWLPDLGLDDDEARALGLAAATLGFGGDGVSRVLLDVPPAMPAGTLTSLPALPYLYRAIAGRCAVVFVHKNKERRVAPGTLTRHGDRWYLGAVDLSIDETRSFRVDRITGVPRVEPPDSGVLTEERLGELRAARPWETGRGNGRPVSVQVDAAIARSVLAELADGADVEARDDGSVVVTIGWGLPGLARGWVLSMLHHARVLSPARVRDEVVEWLEEVRDAPRSAPGKVRWRTTHEPAALAPSAAQRLLAVLTTLAQQQTTSLTALSMRFGLTRDAMRTALLEAACMGVPPFLHGDLLDIQVPLDDEEGDDVRWIDSGLFRPQLTWRDGFELAASARAALALTGADDRGALARALSKLEAVTGAHVDVDAQAPPALAVVESAVADRRQLLLTYYSASSDSVADRRVDPVAVRERAGRYYVLAWCHLANDWRTFRVDRIDTALDVGERDHDGVPPPFDDVFGFADAERVDVALGPTAAWLADADGVDLVGDLDDGRTVVRLAVASTAFLSRLLLQAGTDAEVLSPEALRDAGSRAAIRVLARYGR
jgi:predicted DNA-binding transcriptional regulator YafY